jgi:hypothetical protein
MFFGEKNPGDVFWGKLDLKFMSGIPEEFEGKMIKVIAVSKDVYRTERVGRKGDEIKDIRSVLIETPDGKFSGDAETSGWYYPPVWYVSFDHIYGKYREEFIAALKSGKYDP